MKIIKLVRIKQEETYFGLFLNVWNFVAHGSNNIIPRHADKDRCSQIHGKNAASKCVVAG